MTPFTVQYAVKRPPGCDRVLAPSGLATPHAAATGFTVIGGEYRSVREKTTGQVAQLITCQDETLSLTYHFDGGQTAPYPENLFQPQASKYTRFADDLVAEAEDAAGTLEGVDRAIAIACATAERFTYGHPTERFTDGHDAVPALGCGLTEGSCVDINTYFLAALRAAGVAAGYLTGFYFPSEKGDTCTDGHCWVVTRIDGQTQEWDIAHHLKMGTRAIQPGLNPKPGFRAAVFHSMGLTFPEIDVHDIKALIEPVAIIDGTLQYFDEPEIRLTRPPISAEPA